MLEKDILVCSPYLTSRVKYTFSTLFSNLLGCSISVTNDEKEFEDWKGAKFSYSFKREVEGINFVPHGLLFETGINEFKVGVFETELGKAFFKVNHSEWLFDPFAAAFFLVSRYEEYWPHVKDKHGRFSAEQSIAFQSNFLSKPLINIWAEAIKELLKNKFSGLEFKTHTYKVIPSIDVDSAYAFIEKGLVRTTGALLRSAFQGDFSAVKQRSRAILGRVKDPFDVFDALIELQQQYQLPFIYFILVGNYGVNDKNISITSRKFQALIKHIADYAQVGLHPSFASNENEGLLSEEVQRLSNVVHFPIRHSRQHFLKLSIPFTYRKLLDLEVEHDHSMGYPDVSGFRASICTPYKFYDIEIEGETNLTVHPFCFMEATYKYYQPVPISDVLSNADTLIEEVKKVNGEFCFLWHSDTQSEYGEWEGWSPLLEQLIKKAI